MPEIVTGQDGSFADPSAVAEEAARVEVARAELYDEASGSDDGSGEGLILGKYQSVDDLAQAYQSLQAEYSRLKGGVPQQQQQEYEAATDENYNQDQGDEDQPQVPTINEQQAAAIRDNVLRQAGGEQQYQRLANWAKDNLEPGRVNAFNAALEQGDEPVILSLLKGLQYDFMMNTGYEPRLSGGRAPGNDIKGFASEAQVIEAMNDPRYSGSNPDPAYIKEVEKRIAISNVFQTS